MSANSIVLKVQVTVSCSVVSVILVGLLSKRQRVRMLLSISGEIV